MRTDMSDVNPPPSHRATVTAALTAPSPFKSTADGMLADFRASRDLAVSSIKSGQLGPAAARDALKTSAANLRRELTTRAQKFSTVPDYFGATIQRAASIQAERRRAADPARETNSLLRRLITETTLAARSADYEAELRASDPVRAGDGGVSLKATLDYHDQARRGDDEAQAEWARRRLQSTRRTVFDAEAIEAIDRALEAPELVSETAVNRHLAAIEATDARGRAAIAAQAAASGDASLNVALFLACQLVKSSGTPEDWTTPFLGQLDQAPEAAIFALARHDHATRRDESAAAHAHAELAARTAEEWASLSGVLAQTDHELALAQIASRGGPGVDHTAAH